MMRVPERLVAGLAGLLLCVGSIATVISAHALELDVQVSFDGKGAGDSVVGPGAVHPMLTIGDSGGNDVVAIEELTFPVAYGATKNGVLNVTNANISTPQSARGFADLGSGNFSFQTKKHQYVFTFAPGVSVSRFSVRMLDWGDLLPYGANADMRYATTITAYNAVGEVVSTGEISFTSADSQASNRDSVEYGNLGQSGDAGTASDGQPGNVVLQVTGPGIVRVELHPRDLASTDPHIGFNELRFAIELPDQDEDGVTDAEDRCPDSVTTADSPQVVVGPHTTSVPNVNTVTGPGCSIQDLVNGVAANAKNHGQFVNGIKTLAEWLVSINRATPVQARELHQAAVHKNARK